MVKLMIVDGNALVHRGYHALPELTAPDGRLVNAVYGFFLGFLKAVSVFNPDSVCACFDRPEPTFRHKKFKAYKAQRPKTPDCLAEQIPIVKGLLGVMGAPIYEEPGYEADDLIATIVAKNEKSKFEISQKEVLKLIILTGDSDLLQLVNQDTKVYMLSRGVRDAIIYDEQKVRGRYGFSPILLADYKGLKGDVSDNIPGVPGIGPKTATKLIQEYGILENIYDKIQMPNKLKEKLIEYKEQAFLSRDLARMRKNAPIILNLNDCALKNYDKGKTENAFMELGFKTLISRLPGNQRKQKSLI